MRRNNLSIILIFLYLFFPLSPLSAEWWTADPTNQDWAYFGGNGGEDAWPGKEVGEGDFNGDGYMDVVIGAPRWNGEEAGEGEDEGRVYVYYTSASGLPPVSSPSWFADPTDEALFDPEDQKFGVSVGVGDINNDSYDDLVIGAYSFQENSTSPIEGAIYIFYGSSSGLPSNPNDPSNYERRHPTDENDSYFGYSVVLGDFNNDGYEDVGVGAPLKDEGVNGNVGMVYIYYGESSGLNSTPTIINSPSSQQEGVFGYALGVGDVNGDGICDLVVSEPGWDSEGIGSTEMGRVYIFYGTTGGINTSPNVTINPPVNNSPDNNLYFGWNVVVGDINGGGCDLIISAPYYDNNFANEGGVFIYYNPEWSSPAETLNPTDEETGKFGFSLDLGDIEEDGFSDIIVSAPYTNSNQGKVYIYKGESSGISTSPSCIFEPIDLQTGYLYFGWSVGFVGDVDNNGEENVIITMPFWNSEEAIDAGRVYVNLGNLPIEVKVDRFWCEVREKGIKICWKVVEGRSIILRKKEKGKEYEEIFKGIGGEGEFVDKEVEEGKEYWYLLEEEGGKFSDSLKVYFPIRERKIIVELFKNMLHINIETDEEVGFKVYDITGRELFSLQTKQKQEVFLPVNSGIYFIRISRNRDRFTKKLIIF